MTQALIFCASVKSAKSQRWETKFSNKILMDNQGHPVKVVIKASPGHSYRLLDAKTGKIIKDQYLMKQGNALQVVVQEQLVAEIEDFFPAQHINTPDGAEVVSANYLVDTSTGSIPEHGLITADASSSLAGIDRQIIWPGSSKAIPVDSVAFGLDPIIALNAASGVAGSPAGIWLAPLGMAAATGGSQGGDGNALLVKNNSSKVVGTVIFGSIKTSSLTIT